MATLPDYMVDPNVVLKDEAKWRFNRVPDYARTNQVFEETQTTSWPAGSIELLCQNLVKNWEKEASYKTDPKEWRTINYDKYAFHLNGGPCQTADDMLRLGTYNALIGPHGVPGIYETPALDFSASHKLFKGAMKTFNWEVLEINGAVPRLSIKWRHWGVITGKYSAKLSSGRTVQAHPLGQNIEIFGVTTATVDENFKITKLETFWDPATLFHQMTPNGVEFKEGEKVETVEPVEGSGACPVAQ
ncbi:hypothetical protein RUND412_005497 [Rhizina undulata]